MILFDLTQARLTLEYDYESTSEEGNGSSTYEFRLLTGGGTQEIGGNAVNTLENDAYPAAVADAIGNGENASRIYLKGGSGTYAEIDLFDAMGGGEAINFLQQQNWIINAAYLVFYVDRTAMDQFGELEQPPRLYVYNAETNEPLYNLLTENNVANSPSGTFLNYDGFLQLDGSQGDRYSVNITEHINDIVIRDSANVRLGLMPTPDLRLAGAAEVLISGVEGPEKIIPVSGALSPLGTVLVGSNVDPSNPRRLQLEIHYTEIDP